MHHKAIKRISKLIRKEPKTIEQLIAKLFEEGGELAAEVLKRNGLKGSSGQTAKQLDGNILTEIADVVMIALAIAGKKKYTVNHVFDAIDLKLDKWEHVIKSIPHWKRALKHGKK